VAASVAVACAGPPVRRLAWVPVAGGLAVTAVTALLVGPHREHTTGYARTFWLADPTDATRGRIGLFDLPERLADRAHLVLADLEAAVVGAHVARPWSWLLVGLLLAGGLRAVWGDRARRAHVLSLLAIWLPAMAVWPYASVRFQLPLVPIAALGVGWLAATSVRRLGRPVGTAVVVAALAVSLWTSAAQVRRDASVEAATVGRVADDAAEAAAWAADNVPAHDVIASFAYREVAYRVARPVVPLGYTSDLERLAAEADAAGARWLVVMPTLYGARGGLERAFLVAHAERLRLAHATPTVETYELLPG
jgi:hypothetical protein